MGFIQSLGIDGGVFRDAFDTSLTRAWPARVRAHGGFERVGAAVDRGDARDGGAVGTGAEDFSRRRAGVCKRGAEHELTRRRGLARGVWVVHRGGVESAAERVRAVDE